MKTQKDDRRSQRTRRLLVQALISLLSKKRYEEVTVQDIVDRANVGRSTFYAHYHDKDDLLARSFTQMLESLGASPDAGERNPIFPSLSLFRHVQGHYPLYQGLAWGRGVEVLFGTVTSYLNDYLSRRVERYLGDNRQTSVPLPVLSNYLAGSLLAFLRWWLDNRMPFSAERMDEMFQQLVIPGLQAALGAQA